MATKTEGCVLICANVARKLFAIKNWYIMFTLCFSFPNGKKEEEIFFELLVWLKK